MKTLILYDTLTGNTRIICENLQNSLFSDTVQLPVRRKYTRLSAYLSGAAAALQGRGRALLPLAEDVSAYGRIVLASPVWAGRPTPAVTEFLRTYDLRGRTVHGVLCYERDAGIAAERLRQLIEQAGGRCASVVRIRRTAALMERLQADQAQLLLDPERGVLLPDPIA